MSASHAAGWASDSPTPAQLKELFAQVESERVTKDRLQEFLREPSGSVCEPEGSPSDQQDARRDWVQFTLWGVVTDCKIDRRICSYNGWLVGALIQLLRDYFEKNPPKNASWKTKKVRIVPHRWELDENFSSIAVWTDTGDTKRCNVYSWTSDADYRGSTLRRDKTEEERFYKAMMHENGSLEETLRRLGIDL